MTKRSRNSDHAAIDQAFQRARAELGIRTGFPEEVLREAEQVAERDPAQDPTRADRTALPFCTIDPPGSRDLDQAVHAERRGGGYRVHYAIADVGFFVDRGSALEREAWLRGVTFYAPDARETLYPPALSEGGASLLAEQTRPAILFTLDLDGRGELTAFGVERALVRNREQLTYGELLGHVQGPSTLPADAPWTETLLLLGEIGPKRLRLEVERGGVSLPLRDQYVQRRTAARLGYELVYEEPNEAERWNAQISLLTGHAAALRMLDAGVGFLRTLAPPRAEDVRRFRIAAEALGFSWPDGALYAEFIHGLDLDYPHLETLIWQARRVMRGAGYAAFVGEPPPHPIHAALAFTYAHCTAPLRRLADRYVLDLLITLASGARPDEERIKTLFGLAPVMEEAGRKSHALERRVIDIAEAWTLRGQEGKHFPATVLDVRSDRIDAQIEEPPVRARIPRNGDLPALSLGEPVEVRLERVQVAEGWVRFELVGTGPDEAVRTG